MRTTSTNLMETMGMRLEHSDKDRLVLSMEVVPALHQPYGFLHGGASAALAESAGSMLSASNIDPKGEIILGIGLECHHLSTMRSGTLKATATFIHRGRKTHLCNILLTDQTGKKICSCRLTNMVMPAKETQIESDKS